MLRTVNPTHPQMVDQTPDHDHDHGPYQTWLPGQLPDPQGSLRRGWAKQWAPPEKLRGGRQLEEKG